MTEPARRFIRPGLEQVTIEGRGRWYTWAGERFYSITTIIGGGVPKPALINWAKKFTAEYAIDNVAKLNMLLEPNTHSGAVDREGAVDWLKNAAWRERDRAGELGTAAHDIAEAEVLGRPMPPIEDPHVAALADVFHRFLTECTPTFLASEVPVISRAERYAGTLDAIVDWPDHVPVVGGQRHLIDYKTGKGVYPEVALQLSAYRYADTFLGAPDTTEVPTPEVDGCSVVHVRPDGYRIFPVRADEEVWKVFLYAREVYRWQNEMSRTVIGDPIGGTTP